MNHNASNDMKKEKKMHHEENSVNIKDKEHEIKVNKEVKEIKIDLLSEEILNEITYSLIKNFEAKTIDVNMIERVNTQ